jgi:hypothetical protein
LDLSLLRVALRPIFSLHARNHLDAAREAWTLVKDRAEGAMREAGQRDAEVATMLAVAEDLARVAPTFPLDLRQVAALAGRQGEFRNAAYEARFVVGRLDPRELRIWRRRLPRETPALAKIFGLDLSEDQLRPTGTPNLRQEVGWPAVLVMTILVLAWRIHLVERNRLPFFDASAKSRQLIHGFPPFREKTELEVCGDPSSQTCLRWRRNLPIDLLDEFLSPDNPRRSEDVASPEADDGPQLDGPGGH